MTRPNWHNDAACHGHTHLFFSRSRHERHQAITICHGCPVLADCRQAAITGAEWGAVWGGVDLTDTKSVAATLRRLGADRARSCVVCDATYTIPADHRGRIPVTCSPDCRDSHERRQAAARKARNRLGQPCPICGATCPPGHIYCDDTCQATMTRRTRAAQRVNA